MKNYSYWYWKDGTWCRICLGSVESRGDALAHKSGHRLTVLRPGWRKLRGMNGNPGLNGEQRRNIRRKRHVVIISRLTGRNDGGSGACRKDAAVRGDGRGPEFLFGLPQIVDRLVEISYRSRRYQLAADVDHLAK